MDGTICGGNTLPDVGMHIAVFIVAVLYVFVSLHSLSPTY